MKRTTGVIFLFLLLIIRPALPKNTIKNPDTFILADYRSTVTLDPGVCYSSTAWAKLINIYEPLIFFEGSSTDKFRPVLATDVPTKENGGISSDGKSYRFTIRKGVRFHNGNELTVEDVVYSFKRSLIVDPNSGPTWMLLEALFGISSTRDENGNILPDIFKRIDSAIRSEKDQVIFNLYRPFPPFLSIIAYSTGSIIDKAWAIENGCWDSKIENAHKYNNPPPGKEPLHGKVNGTGPYRLKKWNPNEEFIFERFEGYWGAQPSIKTAVVKHIKEWSTRKLMLQNGDVDRATLDSTFIPEVESMNNLSFSKIPALAVTAAFFCQNIQPISNPYMGSGQLDGKGIPPNFFEDINVRKAFAHCMDRQSYKKDVFNDMAIMATGPSIDGLPYHKNAPVYEFSLEKAASFMKKAWNGEVWKKGFKMTIVHYSGNSMLESAAFMIAENMNALNRNFHVEVIDVDLKDFLVKYREKLFPIFLTAWGADYPDPHNFMHPFMHSKGTYAAATGYRNEEIDNLIERGILSTNSNEREKIYHRLQEMYYENAIGIPLYQEILFRAYRDWIKGYKPHPMLVDPTEIFATLRKG